MFFCWRVEKMNQNIGISFTVKGQEQVGHAVKQIGSSLEQLERLLDKISLSLNLGDKLNMAATATTKLASSLQKASSQAAGLNAVAAAIERIASASGRVQNISNRIQPHATPTTTPLQPSLTSAIPRQQAGYVHPVTGRTVPVGGRGTLYTGPKTKTQIQHLTPEELAPTVNLPTQPPTRQPKAARKSTVDRAEGLALGGQPMVFSRGFGLGSMARGLAAYEIAEKGYQAARWQVRDIQGGEARKDILEANKGLIATDFSKSDRDLAEARGASFSNKFPLFDQKTYLTALAESASSFSPQEVGMSNLIGLNETALKLSTMTGTKDPQKSVQLLTDVLNAKLLRLPAEQQKAAKSPNSTWMSDEAKKIAGQMNAAIRIFPAWGPQIQDFMAQGLGTMMERGWDIPEALGFMGTLKSTGFKASTVGRSAKTLLTKEPRTMARLAMLSSEGKDGKPLIHRSELGKYKKLEMDLQDKYSQWMKDDPDAAFEEFYQLKRKAEKHYADPLEAAGASRDFRSIISTQLDPGIRYAEKQAADTIRQEGLQGTEKLDKQLSNNIPEMVTGWQRLSGEMAKTEQVLAKVSNGFGFFNTMANGFSEYTKALHGTIIQKDRQKLLQDFPNPDVNDEKYMSARAEYLKRGRLSGMTDQWMATEAYATDPRNLIGRKTPTFDTGATGYIGKAWDWISGYQPLSERYRMGSLLDTATTGEPLISERTPQLPYEQQQQNYINDALEGKATAPIPGGGHAPLENSATQLNESASALKAAAHALQSIKFFSNPYADNNRFGKGLLQPE